MAEFSVTDLGTATDIIEAFILIALADSLAGSDLLQSLLAEITATDSPSTSDILSTIQNDLGITDLGTATDSLQNPSSSFGLSESVTGEDVLKISGIGRPKFRHRPGLFVWMDSASLFWDSDTMTYILSDSGSGADSIQVLTPISVSDTATGADAFKSLSASIPVSDATSGADTLQALTAQLTRTDSASGVDAVQSPQVSFNLADSGTVSETAIAYAHFQVVPIELITGADAIGQITASMTVPDSAIGADSPSIEASLGVVDTGAGADAVSILNELSLADAASSADSPGTASIEATVQDSATGDDQITELLVSLDVVESTFHAWELVVGSGTDLTFSEEITSAETIEVTSDLGALKDAGISIDQPKVEASLSLDDAVAGDDQLTSVGQFFYVSVDDSVVGSDEAPEFTIYVPLADSTYGADLPSSPLAGFSLPDSGRGYDASINWTLLHTYRRLRVRFTAKKPGIVFTPRKPGANFTGRF